MPAGQGLCCVLAAAVAHTQPAMHWLELDDVLAAPKHDPAGQAAQFCSVWKEAPPEL